MSKTNDGGPVFPQNVIDPSKGHDDGRYEIEYQERGMSLRDWFAGQCPLERPHEWDNDGFHEEEPAPPDSLGYSYSAVNGVPDFHEDDPRFDEVKQYLADGEVYRRKRRSWKIRKELYLDVAWRFAYADAMLSAREEPTDDE